tara:strand:- start:16 stop:483 length:468 start_codon:yes stop_codon:yes gene_type:complete
MMNDRTKEQCCHCGEWVDKSECHQAEALPVFGEVNDAIICVACYKLTNPKVKNEEAIIAKCEEMFNRVWLIRHNRRLKEDPELKDYAEDIRIAAFENAKIVRESLPEMPKDEGWGDMTIEAHDAEWAGQVEGWLAALRWVLDENVKEFDGWLYDS